MPFADSTLLLEDPSALRERARESGYLFFRGLLPADESRALRAQVEAVCRAHGFDRDPPVTADGRIDNDRMGAYYARAYHLRGVHALPKHPAIIEAASRLFGCRAVPHARTVLRTLPADTSHVWPPHQDFANVATHDQVWNTWVPVGDCPSALGSVSILAGSHRTGLARSRRIADNGLILDEPPAGLTWLTDDLAAGDVLMFNALTFHRGQPNCMPGTLRISVDNCIQPADTPFIEGAFDLHRGDLGNFNTGMDWDDVYAEWPADDPLRYYWREMDLEIVPPLNMPIARGGDA